MFPLKVFLVFFLSKTENFKTAKPKLEYKDQFLFWIYKTAHINGMVFSSYKFTTLWNCSKEKAIHVIEFHNTAY